MHVRGTCLAQLAATALAVLALGACNAEPSSDPETPASSTTSPGQTTSGPTDGVSATSDLPLSGPIPVSDADATTYDAAMVTMASELQQAGTDIVTAQEARDVPSARAGAQRMRDAIFAFDATVRRLDLTAIEPAVDELLKQDGAMLARLDAVQDAFTTGQISQRIARLPTDAYIAAFQAVSDAIRASRS